MIPEGIVFSEDQQYEECCRAFDEVLAALPAIDGWRPAAGANILDLKPHQVATSELAIGRQIEQSEVARSALQLKPNPDRPNVVWFQRTLLPGQTALVPGNVLQ